MKVKVKSKAQVWLERIAVLAEIIPCKLIERQQYQDLKMSITACMDGEKIQSSGTRSRLEDAVVACEVAEEEILDAVNKLIVEKKRRTEILEQLDSPFQYRVMHSRYVQNKSFEEIADELGKNYSVITTAHGRALAAVQMLLGEK